MLAFSKILPNWKFCATNASGLSGGILTAWNPRKVRCRAYATFVGILVKAKFCGMAAILDIINCYGPYKDRDNF